MRSISTGLPIVPYARSRAVGHVLLLTAGAVLLLVFASVVAPEARAQARRAVPLTLESTVDMAVEHSYRVRQLQLGIERTRRLLSAERAELKSRVYMSVRAPEFAAVSEHKWNSDLHRDEIIRENSRLWQMDFVIRQPVVFLGYPTNGYLSLNNRVYRYTQLNGGRDVTYYNRYFVRYEQPFFQPNRLKYDLEEAELDLEREEIQFQQNFVDMLDDLAGDYYELFELAYERIIHADEVENLERAAAAARAAAERDSTRSIEVNQIRVALANAREQLEQARSAYRLGASRMRQRLRLDEADSLVVDPVLHVRPIHVDVQQAIHYGRTLRPRLRELEIAHRDNEISLAHEKGRNSFRMNLELTYGREMQDPRFGSLMQDPSNSYTVGLNAYVPIWDWGERRERIQARRIRLEQVELRIEEENMEIRYDIQDAVRNLREYQERALRMEENLTLARTISEQNLERYRQGQSSALELLQSFDRQAETAGNFLDTFLGYRRALLRLQELTYFDYERGVPLLERYRIGPRMAL